MTERIIARLPEDLAHRAKRKAAADRVTLTALIEDGLRRVLNERPQAAGKRILPRVSSATGGLRSGIDLNDSAALQEMDDLDWLARQK